MMENGCQKKVVWGYHKKQNDTVLHLTKNDINHLNRIYKKYNIQPESIDCVTAEFLLQKENLFRYIIKELDILLKVGGTFEIVIMDSKSHSSYTRSRDQIKYEMSIATNGRYRQTKVEKLQNNKVLKLSYKKIGSTLPENDSINQWSFGIITNGKKTDFVEKLISSIAQQNISNYEIIICGPYQNINYHDNLLVLDDVILNDDIRAPIAAKKNKIIRAARYNNLCILHDRFYFPNNWFSNFKNYGNYFDFLCLPTTDISGHRFSVDWMNFCYPVTRLCKKNKSMRYSQWSTEQIIQGGIILGKKHLISQTMLDERLCWEELEDMHFSKLIYLNGAFINTDVNNFIISEAVNHQPSRFNHENILMKTRAFFSWIRGLCTNAIKFHLSIKKYYSR